MPNTQVVYTNYYNLTGFEPSGSRNRVCEPTDTSHMYYLVSNGNELLQYYVNSGESSELVYGHRRVDAMAVDVVHRVVYYVDSSLDVIKVGLLPGLQLYSELVYGHRQVDTMDVDVVHRVVCYVDSSLDVIKVGLLSELQLYSDCIHNAGNRWSLDVINMGM